MFAQTIHPDFVLDATSKIQEDHHHEDHSFEGLDRLMGISLVLGFIFMMFVDQIASSMSSPASNRSTVSTTADAESLVANSGENEFVELLLSFEIGMINFRPWQQKKRKGHRQLDHNLRPSCSCSC